MRWSILAVSLVGVIVVGCQVPDLSQQQRVVEERFVSDRTNEWTTALNNRELETLGSLYENASDLNVVWPDGQRAIGFDEQEQAIQDFYNRVEHLNFVIQNPIVEILSPRFALVSFRHSIDIRLFNTRRDLAAGFGTLLWKKDETDGLWRIHTQLVSVNPPRR